MIVTTPSLSPQRLPRLPRGSPVFEQVPSRFMDWAKLESDVASRPGFHGYLEISTPSGRAQVIFVDAAPRQTRWSSRIGEGEKPDLRALDGSASLYALDPRLARIAAALERAEAFEVGAFIQAKGLTGLLFHLLEVGATGMLRVAPAGQKFTADPDDTSADVFVERGQCLAYSLGETSVGVSSLNDLGTVMGRFGNAALQGSFYQTEPPQRALNLNAVAQSQAKPDVPGAHVEAVLSAWSELLRRLEARVGAAPFERAWLEAGVALADSHPLLDPFMAELNWESGALQLHLSPEERARPDFATGLVSSLLAGLLQTLPRLRLSARTLLDLNLSALAAEHRQAGLDRLVTLAGEER